MGRPATVLGVGFVHHLDTALPIFKPGEHRQVIEDRPLPPLFNEFRLDLFGNVSDNRPVILHTVEVHIMSGDLHGISRPSLRRFVDRNRRVPAFSPASVHSLLPLLYAHLRVDIGERERPVSS